MEEHYKKMDEIERVKAQKIKEQIKRLKENREAQLQNEKIQKTTKIIRKVIVKTSAIGIKEYFWLLNKLKLKKIRTKKTIVNKKSKFKYEY